MHTGPGNAEIDHVRPCISVGVQDGLPERAGAAVVGVGDREGHRGKGHHRCRHNRTIPENHKIAQRIHGQQSDGCARFVRDKPEAHTPLGVAKILRSVCVLALVPVRPRTQVLCVEVYGRARARSIQKQFARVETFGNLGNYLRADIRNRREQNSDEQADPSSRSFNSIQSP